jgi:hypothetical protein
MYMCVCVYVCRTLRIFTIHTCALVPRMCVYVYVHVCIHIYTYVYVNLNVSLLNICVSTAFCNHNQRVHT